MVTVLEFKQIKRFIGRIVNQSNIRHLNWSKTFRDRVKNDIVLELEQDCPAMIISCYNQYNAAVTTEDETAIIIQKSDRTEALQEADKTRDNTLLGIKSMVESLGRIGTAAQKEAAKRFMSSYDSHGIGILQRYQEETERIRQFIQQCEGALSSDVATLGITALIAQLKTENEAVNTLIIERNAEASQVDPTAMQTARADVDALYKQLVTVINAFAVVEQQQGVSPYDRAINNINADIDYYDKHVFTQEKKLKTLKVGDATFTYASGETWREAIEDHATENAGWSVNVDAQVLYGQLVLTKGEAAVDADAKVETGTYTLEEQDDQGGGGSDDQGGGGEVTPVTPE